MQKILVNTLVILIILYQKLLSPLLPKSCRYYPTCSNYAIEALKRHGLIRGTYLIIRRLARCNPFFEGGFDPVP